eukprot:Protomagalhaensia_sp_Gyna_25__2562@NODE_2454_length_1077_cov_2_259152_g2034_i0_p1_GENE_NODE_2454_length_1077_cov_2_259152_g2034_i0NODE_2454_length_1077_cov_2_259152_g2034_i0_p1_ORF_typecomplete_len273_score36_48KAR9/PF08580_10/1_7_NODE_2454_length_1077_cov_2_259152_g2034_i049819
MPHFTLEPAPPTLFDWHPRLKTTVSRPIIQSVTPAQHRTTPSFSRTPQNRISEETSLLRVIHNSGKRTRSDLIETNSPGVTQRRKKARSRAAPKTPVTEPTTATTEKPYPVKQVATATPFATPTRPETVTPFGARSAIHTPITKIRAKPTTKLDYDLQSRLLGWINLTLLDHLLLVTYCAGLHSHRRVITPAYLLKSARLEVFSQRSSFRTSEFSRLAKIMALSQLLECHVLMISVARDEYEGCGILVPSTVVPIP